MNKFRRGEIVKSVSVKDKKFPFMEILEVYLFDLEKDKWEYRCRILNNNDLRQVVYRTQNQLRKTERNYAGDI